MDGKYHAPRVLRWFEKRLDTGPQNWKQYTLAMLIFNSVLFVFGYIVLSLQPDAAESAGHGDAGPDDDLSHGNIVHDQHQPAALFGRSELLEFQPDLLHLPTSSCRPRSGFAPGRDNPRVSRRHTVGNFFVDMWRVVMYMFVPVALGASA